MYKHKENHTKAYNQNLKTDDKKKILKTTREERHISCKGTKM